MAESEARIDLQGRSIWSGSISFGLVTIPVELYSTVRRTGVSFRVLGPDGTPLVRQYVCPADGRVLARDEIERGYEIREGEFVVVEDEALEALAPERSREIDLERFVPRDELDPAYFVRLYLLVPDRERTKAYRLLAETMERTGRAAIARFVMRGKGYAVALIADHGVLRAQTLRFGDEVRRPVDLDLPAEAEADPAQVAALEAAVAALAADRPDRAELEDPESGALRELALRKLERGEDVVESLEASDELKAGDEASSEPGEESGEDEAGAVGADVVDLMALLKRRMQARDASGAESGAESGADEPARTARPSSRSRGGRVEPAEEATREELYARAQALDIPGRSKMKRAELLEAIRRAG